MTIFVQVAVPAALVEVVRHGQACHWKLAQAAPLDDLSAGSFSGGSTAQGHQGYWVAQQAGSPLPAHSCTLLLLWRGQNNPISYTQVDLVVILFQSTVTVLMPLASIPSRVLKSNLLFTQQP